MRYTARELKRKLKDAYGIHNDSEQSDYYILFDPRTGQYCQLPKAGGKKLRKDSVDAILKQLDIDPNDFDSHL